MKPTKPIRLSEDEVATAAQLAGVPSALAVAVWQDKGFKSVDRMHEALELLADGLRLAGNDWQGALEHYYSGGQMPGNVLAQANSMKEMYNEPLTDDVLGEVVTEEMGYTGSVNGSMVPFNYYDETSDTMGRDNYSLDRYIRGLIEEEFNNG